MQTVVDELKQQIVNGSSAKNVHFSKADALVAQVQTEATADASAPAPATAADTRLPILTRSRVRGLR